MDPSKIDDMLSDLAGTINVNTEVPVTPHDAYIDQMSAALETPRGVAIDAGTNEAAVALRWRYYNARRYVRRHMKVNSFDDLIIKVRGTEVFLVPGPKTQVREL